MTPFNFCPADLAHNIGMFFRTLKSQWSWRTIIGTALLLIIGGSVTKHFYDTVWSNTWCAHATCLLSTDAAWAWMVLAFVFGALVGAAIILNWWFVHERRQRGKR